MASTSDQAPALSAEEAAPSKRFCDVSRGTKEKVIPDARRLRNTQSCLGGAMNRDNGRLPKRLWDGRYIFGNNYVYIHQSQSFMN